MSWQIDFSEDAVKFINHNPITEDEVIEFISKAVRKFKGENINVNIKKMKGEWSGFHRLRVGKIRVILKINFNDRQIYVDRIDFRRDVYK